MDKQTLLNEVTLAAQTKIATKDEVRDAYDKGLVGTDVSAYKKINTADILYYIGGAIIVLGIAIMISQNWTTLGTPIQILVTLGSAIAAYITGVLLSKYQDFNGVAAAFFLISALVMPIGLIITLDRAGLNVETTSFMVLISSLLFTMFLASYFVFKKTIFIFFSIIYGTWVFYAITQWLISGSPVMDSDTLIEYWALVTGLGYILLGYQFSTNDHRSLSGVLYGFGSLALLGSAMILGGFSPNQNVFWELIYPILVFGIILLSVKLKSKTFLVFGSLFLIGYILKLTGEYFSDGLGWPLALVLSGLIIIGISYYAVRISKKYITNPTS